MFFRFTNMDYCDAVSGDFNSGSGGVVFRQSDVFVYSVILILWSFGFGRSICNRYRYSLTNSDFLTQGYRQRYQLNCHLHW
jgi:hypothetical protein